MVNPALIGQLILAVYKFNDAIIEPSAKLFIRDCIWHNNSSNTSSVILDDFLCDNEHCYNKLISMYLVYYNVATRVTSVLSSLLFGIGMRYIGYKVSLLISLSCSATAQSLYIVIDLLTSGKSTVDYFIIASILHGISGLSGVVRTVIECLTAEYTSNEERTKAFSTVVGLKLFGQCIGSLVSGILVKYAGYTVTFTVISMTTIFLISVSLFFLKNDWKEYSKESNVKLDFDRNIVSSIFSRKGIYIMSLILVISLNQACITGGTNVLFLLLTGSPLYVSKLIYTSFLAVEFLSLSFMVVVITPYLIGRFHLTDELLFTSGFSFNAVRWLLMSTHINTWLIFVTVIICSPGIVIIPVSKTLITKHVSSNYLPIVLSICGVFDTFARSIGPLIFLFIYNHSLSSYPSLVLIVLGLIYITMFIPNLISYIRNKKRKNDQKLIGDKEPPKYHSYNGKTIISDR